MTLSGKEGIGAKRARNVWTVVTTTFKAATTAKRRDLRVRSDNPCTDVLPPERGDSRRRTFIYPIEASALLACRAVPLPWRETYAVAGYLYGITWLALAGVDVAKMQRRAGHDNIATTIGYVKTAEDVAGSIGEPFPPLPTCLVSPDAIDVTAANDWASDWTRKRYRSLEMPAKWASPEGVEPSLAT